jgi:putative ABC transport system permease protein
MSGLLFGVGASDPVTFVLIAGVLLMVAILASLAPAIQAMRVHPMDALRYE